MENNQSLTFLKKHGNKTSSAVTLYSHFKSYQSEESEVRYIERKNLIAIANEPLAPISSRAEVIVNFLNQKEFKKRDQLIFPISEQLEKELKGKGFNTWQIGSEPVFILNEYFKEKEYLNQYPIARSLKKRGAVVREINLDEFNSMSDELTEIKEHWLSKKKLSGVEFLNAVDLNELCFLKRYFVLEDRKKVVAYLTALPIFLNNQIIGYFFNDIIKGGNSRSATNELLILESMKQLHSEGVLEVRLGMCALAVLNEEVKDFKLLNSIYEKWRIGYNFKSLFQFKNKLRPTYWRPVYLASNQKNLKLIMINIMRLHITSQSLIEYSKRSWYGLKQNLKTNAKVAFMKKKQDTKSILQFIAKIKCTLSLSSIFISLHWLKNNTSYFQKFFDESAFQAGNYSFNGLVWGPFFHNHLYHLFGDQLSFIIFGGLIEYWFGASVFLMITALGLWLSNPLTHIFLASNLKFLKPEIYSKMLLEKDYGSSNAVFALVGATIYSLKSKAWLLIPMVFHAMFICFQRESFLSIHHFTGMYLGYAYMNWYYMLKNKN